MPKVKVPLFSNVYRNVDGIELNDSAFRLVDGYVNQAGGLVKRPGLSQVLSIAIPPVMGLYWFEARSTLIALMGSVIYAITKSGTSYSATSLSNFGLLPATERGVFTSDGTYVFATAGTRIIYSDGVTASGALQIADADAPLYVTHVDFLDGYILAGGVGAALAAGSKRFNWSDLDSSLSWNALNFASAVGDPDFVTALRVFQREIYLFGHKSIEIWQNDGSNPFSRLDGPNGFLHSGCIAPHSMVETENGIYWLNNKKQFVRYRGGSVEPVSTPFDKEVANFPTITDCKAERVELYGQNFLIFHFEDAGRTLLFNYTTEHWFEWGKWNSQLPGYERWRGNSVIFCPEWNVHIVGDRTSGTLYVLDPSVKTDLSDEIPIRVSTISGHIDYGTNADKVSTHFRMRVKRGTTTGSTAPSLMVRWNDDNRGFGEWRNVSMGAIGDHDIMIDLGQTGTYKTRQYEFACTESEEVVFADAEEEIEVLA